MANPQLKGGYTRIANELLDKLVCLHLSPNQWQVILFVIRKTCGYQKEMDYIANSQIVQATGVHKSHISRAITNLVRRRILIKEGKYIGLQKDYETWLRLPEQVTKVARTGNTTSSKSHQNEQEKLLKMATELPKMLTKVTSTLDTQKKKENTQKKTYKRNIHSEDPDKFIKGRFGHLVHR